MHVEWFVAFKIIYVESSITINISDSVFVMYKSLALRWRLARDLHCDARDYLTPGVVALHIPPSGTTTTVSRQKSTQSCYNCQLHRSLDKMVNICRRQFQNNYLQGLFLLRMMYISLMFVSKSPMCKLSGLVQVIILIIHSLMVSSSVYLYNFRHCMIRWQVHLAC